MDTYCTTQPTPPPRDLLQNSTVWHCTSYNTDCLCHNLYIIEYLFQLFLPVGHFWFCVDFEGSQAGK